MYKLPHLLITLCFTCALFTCPLTSHAAQDNINWPKVAAYDQGFYNTVKKLPHRYLQIAALKDAYRKTFTQQDSVETRDAAFLVFKEDYDRIIENLSIENTPLLKEWLTILENSTENSEKKDKKKFKKLQNEARKWGFNISGYDDHGEYFVNAYPSMSYLAKNFGPYLSQGWQDYFALFTGGAPNAIPATKEVKGLSKADAKRAMLLEYEAYLKKHPLAYMAPTVRDDAELLLTSYTDIRDSDYGVKTYLDGNGEDTRYQIRPAYVASYKKFIAENTDSSFYPLVKALYDFMQERNFILTFKEVKIINAAIKKHANAAGFVYDTW